MANNKKGLGKGLDALLSSDFSADFSVPASTLPISQIESCPTQPRKYFDQEKLEELAESIRQHGLIQPLTVRRLNSGYYQIVAGERRWRAARMAGLTEVPAVVIDCDARTAMELAMVENLQREDLNPIEEAEGFQYLVQEFGLNQEQAAARVGKSRSAVANSMRLLDLDEELRDQVRAGRLSAGHARALLPLAPEKRAEAVRTVEAGSLSVRETEQLVKRMVKDRGSARAKKPETAPEDVDYFREAERDLTEDLGRNCRIVHGKKKGHIEIEYYNMGDLNELIEKLRKNMYWVTKFSDDDDDDDFWKKRKNVSRETF